MSKFLNELRRYVNASVQTGIYKDEYDVNSECKDEALNMIDSLGENARRMLEIGILQDELVKMGFTPLNQNINDFYYKSNKPTPKLKNGQVYYKSFRVTFLVNDCCIYKGFHYAPEFIFQLSANWQEDVLTKVKELINDNVQ